MVASPRRSIPRGDSLTLKDSPDSAACFCHLFSEATSHHSCHLLSVRNEPSDGFICKAEIETQTKRTNVWIPGGEEGDEVGTGIDTYVILLCVCVSCSVLSDSLQPVDWSPPGPSAHGVLQAGILERVAISFSRGSSQPRDQTRVSSIAGRFFSKPPGKSIKYG